MLRHAFCLLACTALAGSTIHAAKAELNDPGLTSVALAGGARTTKLVGSEIYARSDDVGEISDLIVDLQSGRVRAVIVSINGLWGNRLVAVAPSAIKVGVENRLTIDVTAEQLKALPAFEYDEKSAQE
jgi:sporulation protein YlmC with PRC-barrel domain